MLICHSLPTAYALFATGNAVQDWASNAMALLKQPVSTDLPIFFNICATESCWIKSLQKNSLTAPQTKHPLSLGPSIYHLHIFKSPLRILSKAREKFLGNRLLWKGLTQVGSCCCYISILQWLFKSLPPFSHCKWWYFSPHVLFY